jgi:hypothetical protein
MLKVKALNTAKSLRCSGVPYGERGIAYLWGLYLEVATEIQKFCMARPMILSRGKPSGSGLNLALLSGCVGAVVLVCLSKG